MAKIAWIEDDAWEIQDVLGPLRRSGHSIDIYTDFRQVLDRIGELRSADLLLLDILLPTGTPDEPNDDLSAGLKLLVKLRAEAVTAPAIVFSARSRKQHEAELKPKLDIRDWIQKPISRYVLCERVEVVLGTG